MASKTEPKARKAVVRKRAKRARDSVVNKSEEPLYLQVVRALKNEIVKGVHPVGSQLPTEEELCQRFSVSRYTVREALRLLREDHLVSSRKGAGATVVPPRASDSYVHEVMSLNDLVTFATGVRFPLNRESFRPKRRGGPSADRSGLDSTWVGGRTPGASGSDGAGSTAHLQVGWRQNRAGCRQHPSGIPISSFDDDEAGERMIAGRYIACVRFSLFSLCARGARADWHVRQERPEAPSSNAQSSANILRASVCP
jgi:DNA-binding transcriptional regulator YhcF (GntR family)